MLIIRSLSLFLSSRRAVFFLMEVWVMDTSLSATCKRKINQVIKLHRENITLIFALISSNTCHKLTRSCSLGPKLFSNEWYSSQRDYTVLHAVVKTCRYRFRNVVVKEQQEETEQTCCMILISWWITQQTAKIHMLTFVYEYIFDQTNEASLWYARTMLMTHFFLNPFAPLYYIQDH